MKLFLFALALLFVTPFGAAAAQDQATVVASCGSVTLTAGTQHFRTIDTNGVTCSSGGGTQPTSVWSSSDATVNAMTVSNGGLTLTVTSVGSSSFAIVRNSISKTSGKLYIEFASSTGGGVVQLGVASAGVNIGSYLGNSNIHSVRTLPLVRYLSVGLFWTYAGGLSSSPRIASERSFHRPCDRF